MAKVIYGLKTALNDNGNWISAYRNNHKWSSLVQDEASHSVSRCSICLHHMHGCATLMTLTCGHGSQYSVTRSKTYSLDLRLMSGRQVMHICSVQKMSKWWN